MKSIVSSIFEGEEKKLTERLRERIKTGLPLKNLKRTSDFSDVSYLHGVYHLIDYGHTSSHRNGCKYSQIEISGTVGH